MVTTTAPEVIAVARSTGENGAFRRLLRASSVSMLGSHLTTIAYPLLVLRLTGSPFTAGCAVFAATMPSALIFIPAGALVDRWSPRQAMLLSEFGRGVAIGTVVVTLAFGKPIVALLIAVAVIEGVLEVFSGLAERRYVGSLVERDHISSALVRIEARTHFTVVAGRPLGGLLFGTGPILPFIADVASFIYSVTTLLGIKDGKLAGTVITQSNAPTSRDNLIKDIGKGLHTIHQDKFAYMATILFSLGTMIFQALIMVVLGDAQHRQLSSLDIGMVLAASGFGGALGSVVATPILQRTGCTWVQIQACIWATGFAFLLLPAGRQFLSTAIIMAILGLTGALGNIALDTHLMKNVHHQMLARVTSVGRLTTFTACAVGPIMGGVLVQEFGTQHAMLCLFFFTPVLLLLSALTPTAARR